MFPMLRRLTVSAEDNFHSVKKSTLNVYAKEMCMVNIVDIWMRRYSGGDPVKLGFEVFLCPSGLVILKIIK